MAIDFLIFVLLLVSFVINFLALAAFWITPGLRTAANRFTINLLVINLIGCLILAPTLFLNNHSNAITFSVFGDTSRTSGSADDSADTTGSTLQTGRNLASEDSFEFLSKPGSHQMTIRHNGKLVEQEGIILQRNATANNNNNKEVEYYKCNSTHCLELSIYESKIVITKFEDQNESVTSNVPPYVEDIPVLPPLVSRCWSIDMAAALGALAVLLVVSDTWCAVTDPLRYHSRVSGIKTWLFIALTWAVGILFGALSAFRVLDYETDTVYNKEAHVATAKLSWTSTYSVFGIVYACLYFVVIILVPFAFVCGMYWRIFSEARENGLRMRQNGSSPLLQSALNLNHPQQSVPPLQQYSSTICIQRNSISSSGSSNCGAFAGGLHMQIDQRKNQTSGQRRVSVDKGLLPPISDDDISDDADFSNGHVVVPPQQQTNLADGNHNILLTLQTASGEIKRNYSARQLPLLGTSSQDFRDFDGLQKIRQVHSSPNLQKYNHLRQDSISEDSCSPHLLGHQHVHNHALQPSLKHLQHHRHFSSNGLHRPNFQQLNLSQSHVLQIPNIHGSPKTLSYMSSIRHRLSNASSMFKYRDESRAARISILVVIMFLVSYLPYGFLVLLQSHLTSANFESSTQLAIFMILLANSSSAFIFAYRNKRVRRGVKRLFGFNKPPQNHSLYRQRTSSMRGSTYLRQGSAPTVAVNAESNVERSDSRISSCSTNTCKYITPQKSITYKDEGRRSNANKELSPSATPIHNTCLRPNTSCSTISCFQQKKTLDSAITPQDASRTNTSRSNNTQISTVNRTQKVCPKLVSGVTVIEYAPNPANKFKPKNTVLNFLFRTNADRKTVAAIKTPNEITTMDSVQPAEV